MTEHQNDVGELVETGADPLRVAFGAAIEALISMLDDCPARTYAIQELMAAEERTRERLIRRVLN